MPPALLLLVGGALAATTSAASTTRVLSVEGVADLPVSASAGGSLVGKVQASGTSKSLAGASVEPLEVTIPLGAFASSKAPAWLGDALGGKAAPGTTGLCMVTLGADATVQERRCWSEARLSGFALSDLDASSRDAASIVLRFEAAGTTRESGGKVPTGLSTGSRQQVSSNFRVSLDPLPATRVARVQGVGARASGSGSVWVADDVVVALSSVDQEPWLSWHEASVAQGKAQEYTLTVELLDAAMKSTLLTFQGRGVGIFRAETTVGGEAVSRLTTGLYVEQWTVK